MKFIILGCGSSMGVPRIDGYYGDCDPKNKKNNRTRCSAFLKTKDTNILIDTSPDLRSQLLKNKIDKMRNHIFRLFWSNKYHKKIDKSNEYGLSKTLPLIS